MDNISCAILITGHIRNSFQDDLFRNVLNKFKESFNRCDIFIHTWDKYEATSNIPVHTSYDKNLQEQEINKDDLIAYINPTNYIIETQDESLLDDNEEYIFLCNVPRTSMKFIYYSILKAYNLSKEYAIENNINYDFVIKLRPDIYKFPYTANIKNIENVINKIKTFKNRNNFLAGFFHFPDAVLGDNYFFLKYNDGEIYLNKIYNDYSRICDENGCNSPETVVTICKNELKFKSDLACKTGSLSDLFQWIKKNRITKRIICNMLDNIKTAVECF